MIWYILYFVGYLFASRLVYKVFRESSEWSNIEDKTDLFLLVGMTLIVSLFWPLFVVGYYLYKWWKWNPKEKEGGQADVG